jgi:predicted transcriptional regulator
MTPTDEGTTGRQVTLRMPLDLWDALERLAEEAERTPSAEIRLALKNWTKREAVRDRNSGG